MKKHIFFYMSFDFIIFFQLVCRLVFIKCYFVSQLISYQQNFQLTIILPATTSNIKHLNEVSIITPPNHVIPLIYSKSCLVI